MKAIIILISLLMIISNTPLHAQDNVNHEVIQDSIFRQLELYPQEKIHLHTDRDRYVPGEKIWFKAYLVDAYTHHFLYNSNYVYVELINSVDSLINRVMVRKENELFSGHLSITEAISDGNYTIRAYTRYMENLGDDFFFKKNIRIGNLQLEEESDNKKKPQAKTKDDYDVTFYPEGGNLLEDCFSRIAFKALNKSGYSETINGDIIDETGKIITEVKTIYAGMGSFTL